MEPLTPPNDPAHGHPPLARLAVEPLLTGDGRARPAPFHEELRAAHGAVAPVDVHGVPVWLVLGYAQTLDVLRDTRAVWSKDPAAWREREGGRVPADWPAAPAAAEGAVPFADGAALDRLRAAWNAALTAFGDGKRAESRALERHVARRADELITALVTAHGVAGTADLAAGYARPLALATAARLLGLPEGEDDAGGGIVADLGRSLDDDAEASARVAALIADRCAAVASGEPAAEPVPDLPAALHAADPTLTADELARECALAVRWIGGHTAALITGTVVELTGGGRPAGLPLEAVNRAAMSAPPVPYLTFRCPRSDVRLGRYRLAAGDPVLLSPAAAHADPAFAGGLAADAVFTSRAHLAWGAGPHACLGRDLATALTVLAVERLLARFPVLRAAVPAESLEWRATPLALEVAALPVAYEAAAEPVPDEPADEADTARRPNRSAARRLLRIPRRGRSPRDTEPGEPD
ncbi:hypothetical protein [Actinomadura atramentaria]|uniref:hypothetical protein n=1 Tax=Actinomadura atramentaria TaxID=1990 RepID=UPI0003771B03|nr:hypothetical protein [Actinomadura atramentaria]